MLNKDHGLTCACESTCASARQPQTNDKCHFANFALLHCVLNAMVLILVVPGTSKSGTHCSCFTPVAQHCLPTTASPAVTWPGKVLQFAAHRPSCRSLQLVLPAPASRAAPPIPYCRPHVFFGGLFSSSWSTMAGSCMSHQRSAVSAGGHAQLWYPLVVQAWR